MLALYPDAHSTLQFSIFSLGHDYTWIWDPNGQRSNKRPGDKVDVRDHPARRSEMHEIRYGRQRLMGIRMELKLIWEDFKMFKGWMKIKRRRNFQWMSKCTENIRVLPSYCSSRTLLLATGALVDWFYYLLLADNLICQWWLTCCMLSSRVNLMYTNKMDFLSKLISVYDDGYHWDQSLTKFHEFAEYR